MADHDVTLSLQSAHKPLERPGTLDTLPSRHFSLHPSTLPGLNEPGPNWTEPARGEQGLLQPHERTESRIVGNGPSGIQPFGSIRANGLGRYHANILLISADESKANTTTFATPAYVAPSPGEARTRINQSQIPLMVARTQSSSAPNVPGSSRRQSVHPAKNPRSAQRFGGITSGMRVGRAGTSGSVEVDSKVGDTYGKTIPHRILRNPRLT